MKFLRAADGRPSIRFRRKHILGAVAVALAATAIAVPTLTQQGSTHQAAFGNPLPNPNLIRPVSQLPSVHNAALDAAVTPNEIGGYGATTAPSWMASLQYDAPKEGITNHHTCGATLVFRGWVETNAHCVTDPPPGMDAHAREALMARFHMDHLIIPVADKTFHVRVGSLDRTTGGQTATVRADGIVVNPAWNWIQDVTGDPAQDAKIVAADTAFLHLDTDLDAQPIEVPPHDPPVGTKVTEFGWGVDDPSSPSSGPDSQLPRKLQKLDTSLVKISNCDPAGITKGEVCVDNPLGTNGACYGDSGGPVVWHTKVNGQWHDYLVGSTSRSAGIYCGVTPDVYTSGAFFRSWYFDTARGVPATTTAPQSNSTMTGIPAR